LSGDQIIGVAHASEIDSGANRADVVVAYEKDGTIKDIQVTNLPQTILARFEKEGYLKQFLGRNPDDFHVTLGRKGRIKSRGAFFAEARRPADQESRQWFDKIARAVRYNSAFMEVAYFIAQHPENLSPSSAN
jgi:hypothetical protein